MKTPILFSVFLFFLLACQPKVNTTITAAFTSPDISHDDMLLAKKQIESRLGNIKAMNSKVELDENNKTITFRGANKMDADLNRKFKSLFKKSKFEVRSTFNRNDAKLKNLIDSLPEIKGFKFSPNSDFEKHGSKLGYVNGEENQEIVLEVLNNHFRIIKDLKVVCSKYPIRKRVKKDGLYELFLINMNDSKSPIEQSHITGAKSFKSELENRTQVKVTLNARGAKNFASLTTNATRNNNKTLAMLFNNQVLTVPRVHSPIMSGVLTIAFNAEDSEVEELGDILSLGPLSYDLIVEKEND